jgi:2-polyprenyl-6-methoxyphenol hydroxylase-like FAD-dependent oxidoreductase
VFLGYYTASFTFAVDDAASASPSHADDAAPLRFASFTVPGRQVAVYPLTRDRAAAFFVFRSAPLAIEWRDRGAQLAILRQVFDGAGWRAPELLERAGSARDFYFDSVGQVRLPSWSRERVTLVGDACGCPSLLSGQGASLAMAGAYVLAGELNEAAGGHRSAFARYEQLMRPHVEERQARATRFASSFLPSSALGVVTRDAVTRLMSSRRVAAWFVSRVLNAPARCEALRHYERRRHGAFPCRHGKFPFRCARRARARPVGLQQRS